MTQDEIIEMAKEADAYADAMDVGGKCYIGLRDQYFAKLVAAKEREACAEICQSMHKEWVKDELGDIGIAEPSDCARAIRARGTEA